MEYRRYLSKEHIGKDNHISVIKRHITDNISVHFHEFFELELVIGGNAVQQINGESYELCRGCMYLLTPADFHSINTNGELELINIMFDESLLPESFFEVLMRKNKNVFLRLDDVNTEKTELIACLLGEESNGLAPFADISTKSLLEYLLVSVMRNVADNGEQNTSKGNSRIEGALRYLYLHFREDPRLSKVAEISGYTPNYFSKIFADYMGKTYTEYIGMLKTNLARMLLTSTEQTVAQIAFSCGFSSLSNFYRTFNENIGVSPNEYRNKNKI